MKCATDLCSRRRDPGHSSILGRRKMATMFPSGPWWPVALGVAIRLGVWALVPASRFASDEGSYFQVGTALAAGGDQDLFWPPLTGWLIALVASIAGPSVAALRFVWVLFDVGCLLCVRTLASRVAPRHVCGSGSARAGFRPSPRSATPSIFPRCRLRSSRRLKHRRCFSCSWC